MRRATIDYETAADLKLRRHNHFRFPITDLDRCPAATNIFSVKHSRLAKRSRSVKGELVESLGRTADPIAWTKQYPFASLGTVAAAGVAAGWTVGRAFRKSTSADDAAGEPVMGEAFEKPSAGSRLVGGLGTLAGSIAAAVATAAAESLGDFVKDTIRDSLHPDAPAEETTEAQDGPDSVS